MGTRRYRDIDSSTLRSSWHRLSNGEDDDDSSPSASSPQRPLPQPLVNGSDNDEEDAVVYDDACCMYAMCASETSSCRLLPLRDAGPAGGAG